MVEINQKLIAAGETDDIPLVKNLKRIPLVAALASELLATYLMKPIESGSVDIAEFDPQLVYWHNIFLLPRDDEFLLRVSTQYFASFT